VHRAESERSFLVPPGRWFHWFDRTAFEGPGEETLDVALGSTVLLVREGALIPLLRESVDTLAPATDPGVDSYANDPGRVTVRVFPGQEPTSFATAMGATFAISPASSGYDVHYDSVSPGFTGVRFEIDCLHLPGGPPEQVTVTDGEGVPLVLAEDGARVESCQGCYAYDAAAHYLHVSPSPDLSTFHFE